MYDVVLALIAKAGFSEETAQQYVDVVNAAGGREAATNPATAAPAASEPVNPSPVQEPAQVADAAQSAKDAEIAALEAQLAALRGSDTAAANEPPFNTQGVPQS